MIPSDAPIPPAFPAPEMPGASADPLGTPLAELQGTEVTTARATWGVLLYPDRMRFIPPDGSLPYDVFRPEVASRVQLIDAAIAPATLSVKLHKTVPIRLSRDAFSAVENWIGRGHLLRDTLRRRVSWTLMIGLLLIGLSFLGPPPDDADGPMFRPGELDPYSFALGAGFVLLWLLARLRPSRWLFAFDAALFGALAGGLAYRLAHGWSWGVFVIFLLQVLLALGSLRALRRFRGVSARDAIGPGIAHR